MRRRAKSNSNLGKGGRDTGRELSKLLEGAGLLPATILVLSTSRLSWPGSGGGPLWMELDEPGPGGPGPAVSGELLAYTAVLDDVLFGGSALSVTAEEAEVTWQIVEPVLRSWAAGDVPLLDYAAGSPGPPPLEGTIRR